MLISRNWLQSYFTTELPDAQSIADTLMLHAFEIEGVYEQGNDWIIDVDVLPNRAHDCLCHRGFVAELSALLNIPYNTPSFPELVVNPDAVRVSLENDTQCTRYQATRVNNIQVGESPAWLVDYLSAMGQKSINNLVDMTNVIMFDLGQPMHVFDAKKVVGGITVRNAQAGERMTTLGGEELVLEASDLVIADDEGILALAGVKGGTKAEVDENTTDIIIESAHFHPTTTRVTARRVKILTDASKRYENGITAQKVSEATREMIMMITESASTSDTEVVGTVDVYPKEEEQAEVSVHLDHIKRVLGFDITTADVADILLRLKYTYSEKDGEFSITIPFDRLDIRIAEDMIEEIGRMYGYHSIPAKQLDDYVFTPEVHGLTYVSHLVRNLLLEAGYTELMTYTFVNKGDVELYNPLASDKKALRTNMEKLLLPALEKNIRNRDYFGMDYIRAFEIGRVYTSEKEETRCSIVIAPTDKKTRKKYGTEDDQFAEIQKMIEEACGCDIEVSREGNTLGFSLDALVAKMNIPDSYGEVFAKESYDATAVFHHISPYQYVNRDISLWVSSETSQSDVEDIIIAAGAKYLKKVFLFDEFEKEGKKSFAFSLILQSDTDTLSEAEIEDDMNRISKKLEEMGFELR